MKRISGLVIFLLCACFSYGQIPNKTTVSNPQTQYHIPNVFADLVSKLPVVDTLHNPATPYTGAITILPSDTIIKTGFPPIYMTNGKFWGRIAGGGSANIDSITIHNGNLCSWSGGISTCYSLNRYYDSSHLNSDSTFTYHFSNGNFVDSVYNPFTHVYQGQATYFKDTTYNGIRAQIFNSETHYVTADSLFYVTVNGDGTIKDSTQWTGLSIAVDSGSTLITINTTTLQSIVRYGRVNAVVTDTITGGNFNYSTDGSLIDNGSTIFPSNDGGHWVRDVSQSLGFNALWFGIVNDGVTSCTASIRYAMSIMAIRNGDIFFPKGDYVIDSTILLPSNIKIKGETGTRFIVSGSFTPITLQPAVFAISGASNIEFRDITIDCNYLAQRGVNTDTSSHDIHFNNVTIKHAGFTGVYALARNMYFDHCTLDSSGNGTVPAWIHATGCFSTGAININFNQCIFSNNYEHGIYILGGLNGYTYVGGCTSINNGGFGLSIRSQGMRVIGNYVSGNGYGTSSGFGGIQLSNKGEGIPSVRVSSNEVVCSNNIVRNNNGVASDVSVGYCDNIILTGNTIISNGASAYGLHLFGLKTAIVFGNTIVGGRFGGIGMFDTLKSISIKSNIIKSGILGGGGNGIIMFTSSGLTTIASNITINNNEIDSFSTAINFQSTTSYSNLHLGINDYNSITGTKIVLLGTETGTISNNLLSFNRAGNVGMGTVDFTPSNPLSFSNNSNQKIAVEDVATDLDGKNLTVSGGSASAGTSLSSRAGGNLILQSGAGTGSGASTVKLQVGTPNSDPKAVQSYTNGLAIFRGGNSVFGGDGTTVPSLYGNVTQTVIIDASQSSNEIANASIQLQSGTHYTQGNKWYISQYPGTSIDSNTNLSITGNLSASTLALEYSGNVKALYGSVTAGASGISTTSTDAFVAANTTLATSLIPVQKSQRLRYYGTAWNGSAAEAAEFWSEVTPVVSASTPITGYWAMNSRINGGSILECFRVMGDGKIGIGSANPQRVLSVLGSATIYKGTPFVFADPSGTDFIVSNSAQNSRFLIGQTTSTFGALQWNFNATTTLATLGLYNTSSGSNKGITINNLGWTGINKALPLQALHVNGQVQIDTLTTGSSSDSLITVSGGVLKKILSSTYFLTSGGTMTGNLLATDNTYDIGASGATRFRTAYLGTSLFSPLVSGSTINGGTLTLQSSSGTKGKILFGTSAYDEVNNRLGIGTASPSVPVEVVGGAAANALLVSYSGNDGGVTSQNLGTLANNRTSQLRLVNGTTYFGASDRSYQLVNTGKSSTTADFYIQYWDGTTGNDRFHILANGNVGAGVASPTSVLHTTSFATAYRAITALRTLDATDNTIECTSGTFTVTLPTAVSITGREYWITNTGSGTITIGTTSSQVFSNVTATPTTLTVAQFSNYKVVSNGANWLAYKIVN